MGDSSASSVCCLGGVDLQMATHERLVHWVVRRQWRGTLPFDEALHAGRLGLWHALRGYDPARGTRFSSYAVPAIERAVWAAVARHAQGATWREVPPRPAALAGGDLAEDAYRGQVRAAVRALVDRLPPRLRQVI